MDHAGPRLSAHSQGPMQCVHQPRQELNGVTCRDKSTQGEEFTATRAKALPRVLLLAGPCSVILNLFLLSLDTVCSISWGLTWDLKFRGFHSLRNSSPSRRTAPKNPKIVKIKALVYTCTCITPKWLKIKLNPKHTCISASYNICIIM